MSNFKHQPHKSKLNPAKNTFGLQYNNKLRKVSDRHRYLNKNMLLYFLNLYSIYFIKNNYNTFVCALTNVTKRISCL